MVTNAEIDPSRAGLLDASQQVNGAVLLDETQLLKSLHCNFWSALRFILALGQAAAQLGASRE